MMRKWLLIIGIILLGSSLFFLFDGKMQNHPLESTQEKISSEGKSNESKSQSVKETFNENRGTKINDLAFNFTLENLEGEKESLEDYRGKYVVLNFWATTCPPCRMEMPYLNRFHEENIERDIVVIGINIGEHKEIIKNFMEQGEYTFPVWIDEQQEVTRKYGIQGIPTTFFIDPEGRIFDIHIGYLTIEQLNSKFEIE